MLGNIIFHCGSAKTGSTTIQNELWDSRAGLKEGGYHYCPRFVRSGNIDPLNVALRNIRFGDATAAVNAGRQRLSEIFSQKAVHTVIVSNESALGDPFHDAKSGFFPWLDQCLEVVGQLFDGYRVCPAFVVRDQAGLLPSFYMQRLRQGAPYQADEYYKRLLGFDMSWVPVVAKIREVFPSLSVHPFEELSKVENMASALLAGGDNTLSGILQSAEKGTIKNKSASANAAKVIRRINRACDAALGGQSRRVKTALRGTVYKWIEQSVRGEKLILPETYTSQLTYLYSQDKKSLFG